MRRATNAFEITIHQRGKELRVLPNMDARIEPFVYPLLYPSGTFGWETLRFFFFLVYTRGGTHLLGTREPGTVRWAIVTKVTCLLRAFRVRIITDLTKPDHELPEGGAIFGWNRLSHINRRYLTS